MMETVLGHTLRILFENYPFLKPLLIGLIGAAILTIALFVGGMFAVWLERKFAADFQMRYGPNRVGGRFGILQLVADAIKLFTKEDIMPHNADFWLHTGAPVVAFMSAIMMIGALPFGYFEIFGKEYLLAATNMDVGVLYVEAVGSVSVFAIFMAGWGSDSKYATLGAFRSIAKMIGYEVPLAITVVSIAVMAGSLNFVDIVNIQHSFSSFGLEGVLSHVPAWFILLNPLAFILFGICLMADMGSKPFDQVEAEEELVAGWGVDYSGMRFALIYFAEYFHLILGSVLFVLLFLGGWTLPFNIPTNLTLFVMVGKVLIVMMAILLIRWSLPRFRIDQVQTLGWKLLFPLSLVSLAWATVFGLFTGGM
ncbi:MAG: F420H2 dehydrogenase subunit FpoH [Methermicoccaceae archaeon]